MDRHSDPLRSSLERSILRRSDRRDGLVERSQVDPGLARNSIDQILFETEDSWSVDDYFSEEGDDDTSDNWFDDLVAQL